MHNARVEHRGEHRRTGPLIGEEITSAKNHWIKRDQRNIPPDLQTSGFELTSKEVTGILKCKGRIQGYQPTYIDGGMFAEKLIRYTHEQILHFGSANTMAEIRNEFWISRLRCKVKKTINTCNTRNVFRAKLYGPTRITAMPTFRTESGKPIQTTGVDFAGPLNYKLSKNEHCKCYVPIFTCATTRAVHLEMTKKQKAVEFKKKLNAFIARKNASKAHHFRQCFLNFICLLGLGPQKWGGYSPLLPHPLRGTWYSWYFSKTLTKIDPNKLFVISSWIPKLSGPVFQFDLDPPTYQQTTNIIRKMKSFGSPCPF